MEKFGETAQLLPESAQPRLAPAKTASFPRRLITVEEFCRSTRIGKTKFYQLKAAGKIATVHVGRSTRIEVSEVDAFLEGLRKESLAKKRGVT